MKEARLIEPYRFEFGTAAVPKVGNDDVLIKVKYVGICGSDIHIYEGKNALVKLPLRTGHEFSGIVEGYGQGVKGLADGDLITMEPTVGCMECLPCKDNRRNHCSSVKIYGCQTDGAFTEYVAVPSYMVHKAGMAFDDSDMNLRLAALSEPAAVGIHSARKAGIDNNPCGIYFVTGSGVIGVMAMAGLKYLSGGKAKVYAADLFQQRLDLVDSIGFADRTITVQRGSDPSIILKQLEMPDGFDGVIDAIGGGNSLENAILLGKIGSGRIVQLGITPTPQNILSNLRRETTIVGSRVYNQNDFSTAIEMITEGNIKDMLGMSDSSKNRCVEVIDGLDNIVAAFDAAKTGKHMKVMIKVG